MGKKLLKKLSEHLALCTVIVLITSPVLRANPGKQDKMVKSVKESLITLDLKGAGILEILNAIESKTSYKFTYDKNEIDKKLRIDLQFDNKPVEEVLLEISKHGRLKFRQVNNNIHVKKLEGSERQKKIEVVIQTRSVSGKVTSSEENEPLPGVNVIEKGTSNGTVTDLDGNYSIEVADGATLIFSFVGFTSQEVEVGNRSVIDIALLSDVRSLEEIVVVGYGVQREKDLTSSITTVKSEEIVRTPAGQVMQSLQGKVAGVRL